MIKNPQFIDEMHPDLPSFFGLGHIDGLAQACCNSIANALELLQSSGKPSIYTFYLGLIYELKLMYKACNIFADIFSVTHLNNIVKNIQLFKIDIFQWLFKARFKFHAFSRLIWTMIRTALSQVLWIGK